MNHLAHTGAGMYCHVFSRANGLPLWAASLEFKEKISINDEVTTSLGGVAVGEALFQLGDYLTSAPGGGNVFNQVAAWTIGLPIAAHDGRSPPPGREDNLGLSARYWHRFELDLEATRLSSSGDKLSREQGLRLTAAWRGGDRRLEHRLRAPATTWPRTP